MVALLANDQNVPNIVEVLMNKIVLWIIIREISQTIEKAIVASNGVNKVNNFSLLSFSKCFSVYLQGWESSLDKALLSEWMTLTRNWPMSTAHNATRVGLFVSVSMVK